jgi:subtilisin family serine protease
MAIEPPAAPAPPAPPALWRRRVAEALRLLSSDAAGADALARADALWLARVLPESALPAHLPHRPGQPQARAPNKPVADKQPGSSPQRPASAPQRKAEPGAVAASSTASLFVQQPGAAGEEQLSARRVPVPVADALPGRSAIERALKPFLRKRASRHRRVVDAEATAEASAQASAELLAGAPPGARVQALVPVLRPVAERWFDVALLAEQDEAMLVFEDTLLELRNLLARHGAFGQVRLWRWFVQGGAVHVRSPSGMPCAPRAMVQSQRPQLVLVLTHGASAHWEGTPLRKFVRDLAERAVLALVQMLPQRAWGFTALGEAPERVRGRERGAVNRQLQRRDLWRGGFVEHGGIDAVPMLALEAQALADWALFVMSPRLLEHGAVALGEVAAAVPAVTASPPAAVAAADDEAAVRERVLRFRAVASAQAFWLLRLLAGAWITLPVMRLLLQSLPPPRSASALAEVLLSGLLQRVSAPGTPAQDMVFDFAPGVREWLHGSLSGDEQRLAGSAMVESREAIRRFVEAKTGVKLASFSALLLDPRGTEFLPASAKSFVEVSRRLRSLRGGVGEGLVSPPGGGTPPGPLVGELINFPPVARDLVPRQALEDRVAARILEMVPGQPLLLYAAPGAGARTVLARVLGQPALRARFAGGIWYGMDVPRQPPMPGQGLQLALRFGAKARGGDVRVELRWRREPPLDIGYLDAEQAAAHLRGMGLSAERAGKLQGLHGGVPSLVPVVGVGVLLGITRWPRRKSSFADENFGDLTRKVIDMLAANQRAALINMSVLQPGFIAVGTEGNERLAAQLGWLCPGVRSIAATLHPASINWLHGEYPQDVQMAHRTVLQALYRNISHPVMHAYARQHLLRHATAAGGAEELRRVLFDRGLLAVLLEGDRAALLQQLQAPARKDRALAAVLQQLHQPLPDADLVDRAREPLAPPSLWPTQMRLADPRERDAFGAGVKVAIVSTGVDATHPELQHLAIRGATVDHNGHGTAVASILAGRFIGIAPALQLQSVAPLDARGSGDTASLLRALTQLLDTPAADRADIVCLPLSMGKIESPAHPLAVLLHSMAEQGMLLVAAVSNDGASGIDFPACVPEVLSVGALTPGGEPARFSSRGPMRWPGSEGREGPELWALGVELQVALPTVTGHDPAAREAHPARYGQQNGTSFSCAVVAALAARYQQLSGRRGAALRELLLQTAIEGRAHYDPAAGSATAPADGPAAEATWAEAERQTIRATPGKDIVVVHLVDGPDLVLHPEHVRDLLATQQASASRSEQGPGPASDPAQTPVMLKGIEVVTGAHQGRDTDFASSEAVRRVDAQVDEGVYALRQDSLPALKGSGLKLTQIPRPAGDRPVLVLLHGSFIDTAATFGRLWSHHAAGVETLFRRYAGVYALEQPTLTSCVIGNALTLVQALPAGTRLHLAGHSRGGLVAEVLARVAGQGKITERDLLHFPDRTHAALRHRLMLLAKLMEQRSIRVERVVRVACPVRGTLLASKRLDAYLSILKWSLELSGTPVTPALVTLLGEVARSRPDPATLPGLADMLPDSPLIRWLNAAEQAVPGDLRVVAGNAQGDRVFAWLKTLMADAFYWTDSDMVVQTRSTYGGVPREGGTLFHLDQGPGVSHFNYFGNARTARAFIDALLQDEPRGFEPIGPLSWAGEDAGGLR